MCLGATAKSGRKLCRDKSVIGWRGGAAMGTEVVDVFLHVNILSVTLPSICSINCLTVCLHEIISVSVLIVFVYICMFLCMGLGGYNIAQQMQEPILNLVHKSLD